MADVAIQDLDIFTDITPTFTSAAASQTITPLSSDDKLLLVFKNGSGADVDVTLDDKNTPAVPGAVAFDVDFRKTVPAGGEKWVTIKDLYRFKDVTTGKISIDFEDTTSVTWACFRVR